MVKKSKAKMKISDVLADLNIPERKVETDELVPKHTDRGFLSWHNEYPGLESFAAYVTPVNTSGLYLDAGFTLSDGYKAVSISFSIYEDEDEEKALDKINELKSAVDNLERALERAIEARRTRRKVKGE